jgi:hypothetical protein
MKRWVLAGSILAVVTALSACGSQLSEVQTNSGGILDCSSDTVSYAMIEPVPEAGSSAPDGALAGLGDDLVPPGTPQVESQSLREVVFVYTDPDGHRLGRVIVGRPYDTGWLPTQVERCG